MFANDFPEKELDRFLSIESVAEKIFDEMPDLKTGDAYETPKTETEAQAANRPMPEAPETILARTERAIGALVQAFDGRQKALQNDISYYAARRRSQLPDGVELLESEPSPSSEASMMAAIHAMMEEQEAEQYAAAIEKKRERNRRALPALEPQQTPLAPRKAEPTQTPTPFRRMHISLRRAFRKDFFLALALSVWSALAMAVFIEPSITGKLFGASLFLLFVAACMFPDPPARTARRMA